MLLEGEVLSSSDKTGAISFQTSNHQILNDQQGGGRRDI